MILNSSCERLPLITVLLLTGTLVLSACSDSDSTPADDNPNPGTGPVTETPVTGTPVFETPVTETPGTETPGTETPGTEIPGTETPGTETPGTETPGTETPGTETPGTETPGTETPVTQIPAVPEGLIVNATSGAETGQYFLGTPPAAVGSLLLDTLNLSADAATVISGGSLELPVSASTPFSTIYVTSDSDGYFEISLPEETGSTTVVVTYNSDLTASEINTLGVQVASSTGDISQSQMVALETIEVGTGPVQVSVRWLTPTDVDLALIEPSGFEINFIDEVSETGGMLDLDSNPLCFLDNINNENITYEDAEPPSGEYVVVVEYFSSCSITEPTSYVVTVRANGLIRTYSGELTETFQRVEVARFVIP